MIYPHLAYQHVWIKTLHKDKHVHSYMNANWVHISIQNLIYKLNSLDYISVMLGMKNCIL